jgi:hypothetical protein
MISKLLNEKGIALKRSSLGSITPQDLQEDTTPVYEWYNDGENNQISVWGQDDIDQDAIDQYLQAKVRLSIAGEMKTGKAKRRKIYQENEEIILKLCQVSTRPCLAHE